MGGLLGTNINSMLFKRRVTVLLKHMAKSITEKLNLKGLALTLALDLALALNGYGFDAGSGEK